MKDETNVSAYKLVFVHQNKLQSVIYTDYDLAKNMLELFKDVLGDKKVRLNKCNCINKKFSREVVETLNKF